MIPHVLAVATQDEVLRSISSNLNQSVDPLKFLTGLLAVIGLILLLVWIGHYRKKVSAPRQLNHPGKLVKEMTRKVGLKPAELKKLRNLSEQADVSNPIVLLLCPSVMNSALRRGADRDRGA